MSSDNSTSLDKDTSNSPVAVANLSQQNGSEEPTQQKSDDSTALDETNKPPNKDKKIPDIKFEEILKGNFNGTVF